MKHLTSLLFFMGTIFALAPSATLSQTPKCDWLEINSDLMTSRFADALPRVDACIVLLEQETSADHPGMSLSAVGLGGIYLTRAQILAQQGSFSSAESAMNSANRVAHQHGFDNTFLMNWDRQLGSTQGLILEREGRARDAIATYARTENYGRAALLSLDLGDVAEAGRLARKEAPEDTDALVALGGLAEASGDTAVAVQEYKAAWSNIVQGRDRDGAVLPTHFLDVSRVRSSLGRLGAPVR